MAHDQQTYSRGAFSCLLGLGVQLVLAVGALLASFWIDDAGWPAGTITLYALAWYLFAALPIWVILFIAFNEQRRERLETLEAEALARADNSARLFEDHADDLSRARARLANVFRWGVPVLAALVAIFLTITGLVLVLKARADLAEGVKPMPQGVNTAVLMALSAAVAFIAFTVARYLAGMTRVKEWQLLRGGAGHLMGAAVFSVLILIASVTAHLGNAAAFAAVSVLVPALMILLGLEIVASLLLAFYRPRKPGEAPRTPFDSRLLGWLISPQSLGKIVSETINYQFGFEVSRSWFYQLLSRSVTWLVVFGAGTMLLVSCIVVVGPEEQAVITRFGRITGEGKDRVLEPGLYFKLPWPISEKVSYPTKRILEISVGSVKAKIKAHESLLWTTPHGPEKEEWLITAPSSGAGGDGSKRSDDARGLELVGAEIVVQYRVTDLLKHLAAADKPITLLSLIAEREVNLYFASHDIDMLIARGRIEAGGALHESIQKRADEAGLGVTIYHVGLKSIHPPQESDVAAKFLEQIGALQESQSAIEKARQEATETYASVAGSRERALLIHGLIKEADALNEELGKTQRDPAATAAAREAALKKLEDKRREIAAAIVDSPGTAAERIHSANAFRWQFVNSERAMAMRSLAHLASYNNAKQYYAAKLYLDVLVAGMSESRKYVITAQQAAPLRINIDLADEVDFLEGVLGTGAK